MKKKIRLAVIGCGGFTSGKHLPNIRNNKHFTIHALCDLNEKTLALLAGEYSPSYVTTDFSRVLCDPEVDAVVIGTKPSFRLPIMKGAVENSKHIFVEKPMSMEYEETLAMYHLVKDSRVKFMVGHNRPYSPIMQDVKNLFKQARVNSPAEHNNTLITYRIIGEAYLWPEHHRSSIYRGESTIIHELTHVFDLLNWLTGNTPRSVFASGGGSMDNIITLVYPENIHAVIVSGDNGSAGFPKEYLEIATNHNVISARSFVELAWAGKQIGHGKKLYPFIINDKGKSLPIGEYEDLLWKLRDSVTEEERAVGYYYKKFPVENKGHYEEFNAFYRHIIDNEPLAADARQNALNTLIALAAIRSLGSSLPVDLVREFSSINW